MYLNGFMRGLLGSVLVLLLIVAGCNQGQAPEEGTVEVENVTLSDTELDGPVLEGVFINYKDEDIRVAQVRVTIYDSDNNPLGDALVEVRDIEANSRKQFREVVEIDGDVQRARVKAVMLP